VLADYVCGLAEADLPLPVARVQRFAVPAARGVLTSAALALGRYRDFLAPISSAKDP
jgi:hypothetical protein